MTDGDQCSGPQVALPRVQACAVALVAPAPFASRRPCSTSSSTSRRFRRTPATSSACAPTAGARLHLIEPLGFDIDEKAVRRAGMDYAELADVRRLGLAAAVPGSRSTAPRWFAISTRGATRYDERAASRRAMRSCSGRRRAGCRRRCSRPARRSSVCGFRCGRAIAASICRMPSAVVVYEAWRQLDFGGLSPTATCRLSSALGLQRPAHQFLHRIFRRDALVDDAIHLFADRHFHASACGDVAHGARGEHAFDDLADRLLRRCRRSRPTPEPGRSGDCATGCRCRSAPDRRARRDP